MSVLVNNTNGTSSAFLANVAIAGGTNLRANHTITGRFRFTTLGTTDEFGVTWTDPANLAGSYMGRQAGETAGRWSMYRSSSSAVTVEECPTTGYVADGVWRHFAMTYDGTNIRSYIDGVLSNTVASIVTRPTSVTTTALSVAYGGRYVMADVMLFNRVLTANELIRLSKQRTPGGVAQGGDLLCWYPLFADDPTLDYSGNGNTLSSQAGSGAAPAANNEDAGVPWAQSRRRIILPQALVLFSSGDSDSTTAAQGTLRVRVPFTAGAAASTTAGQATLRNRVLFTSGAAISPTSAVGTLRGKLLFAGLATSTTSAVGTFRGKPTFAGAALSTTAAVGTLQARVRFTAGTCTSNTSCVGTIQAQQRFTAGSCVSTTSCVGSIGAKAVFAGASLTPTAAVGTLTALGAIYFAAGACTSPTAATGFLRASRQFAGACVSTTSCTGSLKVLANMAGACVSPSAAVGTLRVRVLFAGACVTRSSATGVQSGGTVISPVSAEDERNSQKRRAFAVGQFRRRMR